MSATSEAREAAAVMRTLLGKIDAGELDAPAHMVRQLVGALAALEAMSKRDAERRAS